METHDVDSELKNSYDILVLLAGLLWNKRKKEEICMFDRGAAEACIEQNTRWDVGNVDDYDERMGYGM